MTKFESVGVSLQYDSCSISQASKRFSNSCTICCKRGLHIDCDRCAVAAAHKLVVAAINTIHQVPNDGTRRFYISAP